MCTGTVILLAISVAEQLEFRVSHKRLYQQRVDPRPSDHNMTLAAIRVPAIDICRQHHSCREPAAARCSFLLVVEQRDRQTDRRTDSWPLHSDPSTVRKKYTTFCRTSEKNTGHFAGHLKKIQDILQDIWKKYRTFCRTSGNKYRTFDRTSEAYFATSVRHYLSRQYSKSSETFCKCIVQFVQIAWPDVNHHRKMTVGQFFVDQIRDCRVHVWPIGRQHDKLVDR